MMKLFIYASILCLLCCCGKMEETTCLQPSSIRTEIINSDSATVTFNFSSQAPVFDTRAGVDYILKDVNVYLYHHLLGLSQHHYRTGYGARSIDLRLPNGTYTLYVVGNYGSDMGEKLQYMLAGTKVTVSSEAGIHSNGRMIPMSAKQTITIERKATLNVSLGRLAAKVTFRVDISEAFSEGTNLVHLQLFNCNTRVEHFRHSRATAGTTMTYPPLNASSMKGFTKSWYLMENRQGSVYKITSPRDRSSGNAPYFATYLWLRIERNGKFIDYRVYLGENDTDNFDVRRNTHYIYKIVIGGENPDDLRVSTVSMKMHSGNQSIGGPVYDIYNRFVWKDKTAYCYLHITTTNNESDNIYSVSFKAQSDDFRPGWYIGYCKHSDNPVSYEPMVENKSYPVFKGNGSDFILFSFYNGGYETIFDVFLFTVTDKYGYQKQFTVTTRYNSLHNEI